MASSQTLLVRRRQQFAQLEQQALRLAQASTRESLGVGDVALASGEQVHALQRDASSQRSALALTAELTGDPALPRPGSTDGSASPQPPFAYQLPAAAPVVEGLGAINEAGVRSRGVTLQTSRGAPVITPAAGIVRFSGPFQSHDGVVIIDHGGGWTSLLVGVGTTLPRGAAVAAGQPLGRALGPLEVELSHGGARLSPALIAGSSATLSNRREGG